MGDIFRAAQNPQSAIRNPQSPSLSIIVAMDQKGVIGRAGKLPWHLSSDLRRFKKLTTGHCLLMGRRTFDSIGRILPGRVSIVITRNPDEVKPSSGLLKASGLDDAIRLVAVTKMSQREVFVVGGGEIYHLALPFAERLYITRVLADVDGDTWFPKIRANQWRLVQSTRHNAGPRDDHDYVFETLERIR